MLRSELARCRGNALLPRGRGWGGGFPPQHRTLIKSLNTPLTPETYLNGKGGKGCELLRSPAPPTIDVQGCVLDTLLSYNMKGIPRHTEPTAKFITPEIEGCEQLGVLELHGNTSICEQDLFKIRSSTLLKRCTMNNVMG